MQYLAVQYSKREHRSVTLTVWGYCSKLGTKNEVATWKSPETRIVEMTLPDKMAVVKQEEDHHNNVGVMLCSGPYYLLG